MKSRASEGVKKQLQHFKHRVHSLLGMNDQVRNINQNFIPL
jgi:hypothetical protein